MDPCASQNCTHRPEALTNSSRGTYPGVYFLNSRKNAQFSRVNARFPEPRLACAFTQDAPLRIFKRAVARRVAKFSSRIFTRVAAIRCTALYNVFYLRDILADVKAISFFFSRVPVPHRSMELSTA